MWVAACDEFKIKITAKQAQPAVLEYRHRQGHTTAIPEVKESPSFSQDAFVDAITEWIIADDQVCKITIIF
jgi:hypothetical protein